MVARSVIWWFLMLGWAFVIFDMSTAAFGECLSRSLLANTRDLLRLDISEDTVDILNAVLRKLAHLTEYGVLGLLLYGSFGGKARFSWRSSLACWCVAAAGAYSLTDEFHQSFVPGRHSSPIDCSIDAAGAVIAMLLIYGGSRFSDRGNSYRGQAR